MTGRHPAVASYHPAEGGVAARLLLVLTIGAYLPTSLYPAFQRELHISDLCLVGVYSALSVASIPGILLFGPASDALGRRAIFLAAIALAAVGSVLLLLARNVDMLIAARACQGLALGAATSPGAAAITESFGTARRGITASVVFLVGNSSGLLLGGFSAQFAPAPQALPFVAHLVLLAVGTADVCRLPRSGGVANRWRPVTPTIPGGSARHFWSAAATGVLAWAAMGVFVAILPTVLDAMSAAPGLALVGSTLAGMFLLSAAADPFRRQLSHRSAQATGLALLVIGLVFLSLVRVAPGWVVLVGALVAGLGHGSAIGAVSDSVDAMTRTDERGGVNSSLYTLLYLGTGVPSFVVGLVSLAVPLAVAVQGAALALAAAAAGHLVIVRASSRKVSRPSGEATPVAADLCL